ncbi:MAG: GAF domain-containing protein [Methylocella sp.]
MSPISVWFSSFKRVIIATATFAAGALLKLLPSLSVQTYIYLGALVFALVFIEEFITTIRPAARLREIAPLAMDAAAVPVDNYFKSKNIDVRMSVFKSVRVARRLWCARFFRMMWNTKMDDSPDVNITFPVSHGVSGQCFTRRQLVIAGDAEIKKYKLPEKFMCNGIGDLKLEAILCYPIYEPKKDGRQSGKVIGVLNLDTLTPGAYATFSEQGSVREILADIQTVAGLAARIYK